MKVTLGIRGKKYYKIPPRPFVTNNVMFCPVWENCYRLPPKKIKDWQWQVIIPNTSTLMLTGFTK